MAGQWAANPLQKVPPRMAATLVRLRDRRRGRGGHDRRYHAALVLAWRKHWSVAALAVAVGSTPGAVSRMIHRAKDLPPPDMAGIRIPAAPPYQGNSPNVAPPENIVAKVGMERVLRLRKLRKESFYFRGQSPADSPARAAAQELAAELHQLVWIEGYRITHVAHDVLQVTTNAVANRLRNHGYPTTRAEWARYQQRNLTSV
jgi:hypothetical protein